MELLCSPAGPALQDNDVEDDEQVDREVDVFEMILAGPAVCLGPVDRGSGVAAVGPCPPRLPPPDRQRPRGEAAGVAGSTLLPSAAAPAFAAFFAAAVGLG